MTACSSCGADLPEGALFCPDCGAPTPGFGQATFSPSHFNTGMTSTSQTLTTGTAPQPDPALSPPPFPEERRRPSRRRGLMIVVIAILAVLLIGTTFEAGLLGSGGPTAPPAVNSASDPLTGAELISAYAANSSQAMATYTNKTVYVQDSLSSGLQQGQDGQYFSLVDSGMVLMSWGPQVQPQQLQLLVPGATVLARCLVSPAAEQDSPDGFLAFLFLQNCDLLSVASQAGPTATVSAQNL